MKLALVTRRYPPLIGGAEKVLSYLAAALAAEGAEVTVLTSRVPGLALPAREEVPVEASSAGSSRPADGRAAGDLAAAVLGDVALHAEPRALVRAQPGRPGVCLDAQARRLCRGRGRAAAGLPGRAAARGRRRDGRYRLAVLGELRPQDRPAMPGRHGLRRDLQGHRGRAARRLASGTMRVRADDAPPSPRIASIPNGVPVPPAPWQRRPDWRTAPRAAFVGRLAPEKGLDTLIDAWPAVRRRASRRPADPDRRGARTARAGGPGAIARPRGRAGPGRRDARRRGRRRPPRSATPTCSSSPRARRG